MNFQIRHLTFPTRTACTLCIDPIFPQTLSDSCTYTLTVRPVSGVRMYGLRETSYTPTQADVDFFSATHTLVRKDDHLELTITLPQEDCYACRLFVNDVQVEKLEFYALDADLFDKTPLKGDNHMHTVFSDGKESPMYMAAVACRLGYDYCAITDHRQIEPSLLARDFYKDTGVDFVLLPGEEVHSPDNPVHLINLGSDASVNDWWRDHEDEYRAAVEEELKTITEPMTDKDRYAAAASQVMFDRIRSVNGVSILCHPNWILAASSLFNEAEDVTDYLFDHRRFDALELIAGGAYEDGTQMQVSYYHDRETMPIVGSSDVHNIVGERLEPGNYSIVFADATDAVSIREAIRAGRAIAGNKNKLYGDYRLVKYGYFLLRSYYPEHDAQRNTLGASMQRLASALKDETGDLTKAVAQPRPSELFAPRRYSK